MYAVLFLTCLRIPCIPLYTGLSTLIMFSLSGKPVPWPSGSSNSRLCGL